MFNRSDFASFVWQSKRHDLHKVKNAENNQFGERASVSSRRYLFTRRTSVTHIPALARLLKSKFHPFSIFALDLIRLSFLIPRF